MKILVLGSGGREHAIAWKLSTSKEVERVFVGPGNAGTGAVATNIPAVNPLSFATIEAACRANDIDCVFVGPETPLAEGVVDYLHACDIPAIGPSRHAAQLESSKAFSKSFLVRNSLPTAEAVELTGHDSFERSIRARPGRHLVVKKSGLAAGKGVLDSSDAKELLDFGNAILGSDSLLVEEFLEGWEVSIFGLSDGKHHVILPPCTDFKKAHDGDTGPNTGGMGSICPVPWVDAAIMRRITTEVVEPTYAALGSEGLDYVGVLYFGLMITAAGPKILEFNVRFGDPETQVLMPMLAFDLGVAMEAMLRGNLNELGAGTLTLPGAALGVVVASRGYPENAQKGAVVRGLPEPTSDEALLFHASTSRSVEGITNVGGGRCFSAVGRGADLAAASRSAYKTAARVDFDGAWYRTDIGGKFITQPRPEVKP